MMDRDDVIDLLSIISASDHRTVGLTDIQVWQRTLGRIDKDAALDAVLAHFRERPGVWLEPGHIVARVKAAKRDWLDRADPDERGALAGPDDVPRDRYRQIDKGAPDEDDYPAEWDSRQRLTAYWAKINAYRDGLEYEQAVTRPGSLLTAPPASDETRAAAMSTFVNHQYQLGDDPDDGAPYVNPVKVGCSFCKSAPGDPCTVWGLPGRDREKLTALPGHPARIKDAALAAGYPEEVADSIVDAMCARQAVRTRAGWRDRDKPDSLPVSRSGGGPDQNLSTTLTSGDALPGSGNGRSEAGPDAESSPTSDGGRSDG